MDSSGKLWLGGVNQFGVFDPESGNYESRMDWIPEEHRDFGEVWTIHHDESGLWMGTHNRLFHFKDGKTQVWRFAGRHRVIFHFVSGEVFAHEAEVGLWKIHNGQKLLVNSDIALNLESIVFLERFEDGFLYGYSKLGIIVLSFDGTKLHQIIPSPLTDAFMSCGIKYKDRMILGTLGSGIFMLSKNGEILSEYKDKERDGGDLVLNIKLAADDRVWILDDKSTKILNLNLSVGYFDIRNGLPNGEVRSVSVLNDRLVVAMDKGVYDCSSQLNVFDTAVRVSEGESKSIIPYRGGYLFDRYSRICWAGGDGIVELHNFPGEIMAFTVGEGNILWVCLNDRVQAYRIDMEGKVEFIREILTDVSLARMETDGDGRIWGWAPLSPLLEIDGKEPVEGGFRWHGEIAGMDLRVEDHEMTVTQDGPVLVFKDQLVCFDPRQREWRNGSIEQGKGIPEAMAFRAGEDLLTGWLIYWDEKNSYNLMKKVEWDREGAPDWKIMPWIKMNSIGRVSALEVVGDEQLTFVVGGLRGILMADGQLESEIPPPQIPLIYGGDDPFLAATSQESDFGLNPFRFRFTTALGEAYYPIQFETRLKGRDDEWTDAGFPGLRELGQLLEGEYVFEVRSADPFGRVSPAASINILVHPPLYRSPWAILFYILCVLTLLLVYVRVRERRLRGQQLHLEGLVRQRTADLEKANEFKDDFIANLSHEIRNPLNGVIGLIQQLKPGVPPPERYLGALQGAAHYLQTTVEEVLDFSKLQSGELTVDGSLFDLHKIVTGVIEIYRTQASAKGVELTSQVRMPEGIGVFSDATKVQQIIGNLTGNAVKFTKAGAVHVGVILTPDDTSSGMLRIWVEDSGPGIAEADKKKIFDKFYQAKDGVQKTSGTGLGLALVKRYTDCLDGQIELKSETGIGSTFQVILPVQTGHLLDETEGTDAGKSNCLKGLPVLVVEDIEYNRITLEGQLTQLGCVVDFAENGPDGLKMAMTNRYRVIFLDWDLPGMKGLEVARRLRAGNNLADGTRIIGMTAFATSDVREKCLGAGMDDFLTKPLSTKQITRLLVESVEQTRFILGRGLLAEMGKAKSWEETIERWIGFHESYLAGLKEVVHGKDAEAVRKAAHRLLGHLGMLELRELPDTLKDLLTVAQSGDLDGITREWAILEVQLGQFEKELEGLKKS
jgi:signal transduction histidine kinase/CheY-like chemotaxis protein